MKVSDFKKKPSVEKREEGTVVYRSHKGTVTITKTPAKEEETKGQKLCPHCRRYLSKEMVCKRCGKITSGAIARTVDSAKKRRSDSVKAAQEKAAKEAYFEKRNAFYKEMRSYIKEHELFQKKLKKNVRNYRYIGTVESKESHLGNIILLSKNTEVVTLLYLTVAYIKHGEAIKDEVERRGYTLHDLETFINEFFRKKPEFRKMYWTIWKKKFVK